VLLALLERVPVGVGFLPSGVLVGEVGDYLFVGAPGLGDLDGGGDWEFVSFLLVSGLGLTLAAGGLAESLSGDFAPSS
jgi:hypothetical protein